MCVRQTVWHSQAKQQGHVLAGRTAVRPTFHCAAESKSSPGSRRPAKWAVHTCTAGSRAAGQAPVVTWCLLGACPPLGGWVPTVQGAAPWHARWLSVLKLQPEAPGPGLTCRF